MLVVDASFVVDICLSESPFDALEGEELVAPRLLWSEVPSALHELSFRGAVSEQLGSLALDRFLAAPIKAHCGDSLTRDAWRIADELGWAKTYDAEYVALASRLQRSLVTADARLRRGAARVIDVRAPTEL